MKTIEIEERAPLAFTETYLAVVRNSVGASLWRNLYVIREFFTRNEDVIGDGDLACAFYVSTILHMFNLIKGGVHTTVDVTVQDLLDSDWVMIDHPQPGAVVVWGKKLSNTDQLMHRHIGICLDDENAVSTNPNEGSPVIHRIDGLKDHEGNVRPVEMYYVHLNFLSLAYLLSIVQSD